jgi:hypothetical protein
MACRSHVGFFPLVSPIVVLSVAVGVVLIFLLKSTTCTRHLPHHTVVLEAAKKGKRTQILELRSKGAPVDFVDPNNKLGILHVASERVRLSLSLSLSLSRAHRVGVGVCCGVCRSHFSTASCAFPIGRLGTHGAADHAWL